MWDTQGHSISEQMHRTADAQFITTRPHYLLGTGCRSHFLPPLELAPSHSRHHGSTILPQAKLGWGWAEAARSQIGRSSHMLIKFCILLSENLSPTFYVRGVVTAEYSINDTGFRDHWKAEFAFEHSLPGLCDTEQVTKPL